MRATPELSRVVGALGTPDQTVLDSFVSEQRLSSVMVLDENMRLQAHAGSDTPEHWENLFQSGVIQDIAEHPQKVYFSWVTDGDSVYDVAAVARRDAPGVVFTSHEQEKDVEGEGDFSLDELFSGFTFDMDGVVAVSDGKDDHQQQSGEPAGTFAGRKPRALQRQRNFQAGRDHLCEERTGHMVWQRRPGARL